MRIFNYLMVLLLTVSVTASAQIDGNFKRISVKDSIWLNGKWVKAFSDDSTHGSGSDNVIPTQSAVKRGMLPYVTVARLIDSLSLRLKSADTASLSNRINARITAVDAAATFVPISQKAAANGVATLGSNGKIPSAQIPAIAISETFVVASQAAMLSLIAETGDVAVRTDLSKSFILSAEPASTLGNWQELLTPTAPVQSVNGQTGNVNLTTDNVSEGTNLYWTNARGDARYPLLSGSYSNPSWITAIDWSKLLNVPASFPTSSNLQAVTTNGNGTNQQIYVAGSGTTGGVPSANSIAIKFSAGIGGSIGSVGAWPTYLSAGGIDRAFVGAMGGMEISNPTGSVDALTVNHQFSSQYNIKAINTTSLGATSGGSLSLRTGINPTAAGQRLGLIAFGSNSGGGITNSAQIWGVSDSVWASNTHNGSHLRFYTTLNAAGSPSERMRIDNWGNVGIGTAGASLNQWERLKVVGNATITNNLTVSIIPPLATTATTFLTHTSGLLQSRTPAQVLSDIGAAASNIGLQTVVDNANASPNRGIDLGSTSQTGNIPLRVIRSVGGTPYTLTMGVGIQPGASFILSNGVTEKWLLMSDASNTLQYSNSSGSTLYDMWHSNNHPAGSAFTPTLTGANVLSGLTVNSAGHISALTTRAMTPADIGAAPASASTFYLQNQLSAAQSGAGAWTAGSLRASTSMGVWRNGSNSVDQGLEVRNAAGTLGAIMQLNADAAPGLVTYLNNATSWIKRQEQFANNGLLRISADGGEGISLYRAVNAVSSATGGVRFEAQNSTPAITTYGQIWGIVETNTAGAENGAIAFNTRTAGSVTEKMRLASTGILTVNNDIVSTSAGATGTITARSTSTGDAVLTTDVSGVSSGSIKTFRTGGRTAIINNANEAITILTSGNVGVNNASPAERLDVGGNIQATGTTSSAGVRVKEGGAAARMGIANFASGAVTATVNTTAVTANSRIFLTIQSTTGPSGVISTPFISARTAGTSFTIRWEKNASTDVGAIAWMIVEPY